MPLDNLDDYSPELVEAGAGGAPAVTADAGGSGGAPTSPPSNPSAPGATGGGSSASGGSGNGSSGGSGNAGSSSSGGSSGSTGSPGSGSSNGGSGNGSDDPTPADAGAPDPGEPSPEPAGPCAEGELEGPTECFFLDAQAQTFFAARTACRARGTGWDLASVRSAQVSALLGDTLTFEAWLVGSDVVSEGNWVWLDDGTPFWQGGASGAPVNGAYTNWNASEPNGATTTNCLRALPRSFGSANPDAPWADLPCSDLRGSICKGPQL